MVSEIRVYAERGGNEKETKAALRRGLSEFLKSARVSARLSRVLWSVIACGSRNETFDNFKTALKAHPLAFNILLVDSEGPVTTAPWKHLQHSDGWADPCGEDEHCHLMVQTMESWLIADVDALRSFYGQGFNDSQISKNPDVETLDKIVLVDSLKAATRNTNKGAYHKTRHAPKLLGLVDTQIVRSKAKHCERLFVVLQRKIAQ